MRALVIAVLLLNRPAAAEPPAPPPITDWVEADPGGSTSDGNVSAPDKMSFWARLQDSTFDGLCRQAEIPIDVSHRIGDIADPHGGFHRYIRQLPTGELAVIDEARLSVPLGWLPRRDFDRGHLHAGMNLFLGARIEGRSAVVRRLKTPKACAELSKMLDFRTIKTALPITAERIAKMDVGEIWQLPVEFRVGVGGSVGDQLRFPVSVGLGAYREGGVTVTLRRLDEHTVRFRLRLEQATLYDAAGKVNANIPILLFGLPAAEGALAGVIGGATRALASALNDYLAVQLDVEAHRAAGVEHALEFSLDPADPRQMDRLAAAIKGDLSALDLMKRSVSGLLAHGDLDPWDVIEGAAVDEKQVIGAEPSFAGEDRYKRVQKPFKFRVPIAFRYERSTSAESDRVFLEDRAGGEYSDYRAEKRSRHAYLDIPFLGELFARDAQKNADVLVHRDPGGKAQGPAIVYVQQEGFLRQDAHDARAITERADAIVRLAGAALPLDKLLPPSPKNPAGAFWRESEYRRGVAALTVVLEEPAVKDILAASTKALLGAYANTLEGPARLMGEWLAQNATTTGSNVAYDKDAAKAEAKRLAASEGTSEWRLLWTLHKAAKQVSALASQLVAARNTQTEEGQAHGLAKLLSASGHGNLSYGDAIRVLIQLADPLNISGEFFVDLVGGGGPEARSRWLLHAGAGNDPLLDGATQAKARFRQPTTLSD